MSPPLRSTLLVLASAIVTLVLIDLGIRKISPMPPPLLEVADGMAEYEGGDPEILAIGSSHTRSFAPMRDALAKLPDPRTMVVLPVEAGSFGCYEWVVKNRFKPLMEEKVGGEPKRKRLSRVIMVTTYYDICNKPERTNLPGRAWTAEHFFSDVLDHGITDFNRNYLGRRFNRAFLPSRLVQDRGIGRLLDDAKDRVRSPEGREKMRAAAMTKWQQLVIDQYGWCDDEIEKKALYAILDFWKAHDVEVTMALFPLMPTTITEKARDTTVKRYADFLEELSHRYPIRVVDMTYSSPLGDGDFMADMDHATLEGNRKFSEWALEGPMAYLKEKRTSSASKAAPGETKSTEGGSAR